MDLILGWLVLSITGFLEFAQFTLKVSI